MQFIIWTSLLVIVLFCKFVYVSSINTRYLHCPVKTNSNEQKTFEGFHTNPLFKWSSCNYHLWCTEMPTLNMICMSHLQCKSIFCLTKTVYAYFVQSKKHHNLIFLLYISSLILNALCIDDQVALIILDFFIHPVIVVVRCHWWLRFFIPRYHQCIS